MTKKYYAITKEELSSPYKLIGRDKAERWIQTTLLPHEIGCVPILVLSKQCDPSTLLYRDVNRTNLLSWGCRYFFDNTIISP